MLREYRRKWNDLLAAYYEQLSDDCLCPEKRVELLMKARHYYFKSFELS